MRRKPRSSLPTAPFLAAPLLGLLLAAPAAAQVSTAQPPGQVGSAPPVPGGGGGGGFLAVGADDCASPHTQLPAGDVVGAPFVTGTTGSAGQNEALCYSFWTTGIDADVWFDWSATVSGPVELSFCGNTTVDTKAAVWPGSAGCPLDGTAVACNEDGCGLQSKLTFPGSVGTTYTLQVGTFPGAAGGSGSFDLTQIPAPICGLYDDGVSDNAGGFPTGGEIMWMHRQECLETVDLIETAFGSLTAPNAITNGAGARVCLWEDADCDLLPTTGMGLPLVSLQTVVVNGGTDVLNPYPLNPPVAIASGCSWVGASADHFAGEFPVPLDQSAPTAAAWIVGSTLAPGTLDVNDLGNNNVGPEHALLTGLPGSFLLRATGNVAPSDGPGTPVCFGDGSGIPCPCGNSGANGHGCAHGAAGSNGVWLRLVGTGSVALGLTTVCEAYDAPPSQPGVFFQGNQVTGGGNGTLFGDGLRCCGQSVVRLELVTSNAAGVAATTVDVAAAGGVQAGDSRCYQYWYRDPVGGGACGSAFNLSNGYTLVWAP